ncbi:hypothetical protein Tco_1008108 [Tanacetum coccineum]
MTSGDAMSWIVSIYSLSYSTIIHCEVIREFSLVIFNSRLRSIPCGFSFEVLLASCLNLSSHLPKVAHVLSRIYNAAKNEDPKVLAGLAAIIRRRAREEWVGRSGRGRRPRDRIVEQTEPKIYKRLCRFSSATNLMRLLGIDQLRRLRKRGNVGEPSKDKNDRDDNKRTKTDECFCYYCKPCRKREYELTLASVHLQLLSTTRWALSHMLHVTPGHLARDCRKCAK